MAQKFLDWQKNCSFRDILVFTDGSKIQGLTGAGCYILQGNVLIAKEGTHLGLHKEVFDAEAFAALRGLQLAMDSPGTHLAENLYICLDNLEVALRLLYLDPPESSQDVFLAFRKLANQWPTRNRLPLSHSAGTVQVRWCPGHQSIKGNEEADRVAKSAALLPVSSTTLPSLQANSPPSLSALRRLSKQLTRDKISQYWATSAPQRYQDLNIPWAFGTPRELHIKRRLLGLLLAARSGHGDFKQYHERFNHEEATLFCSCGKPKAPEHFFFCVKGRRKSRALLQGPPRLRIPELLGTPKGAQDFTTWINNTNFFSDICHR